MRSRWPHFDPRRCLVALAPCAAALLLVACVKDEPAASREWAPGGVAEARAELLAMRNAPDDLMSPVVRGGTDGLEIVWFIALDETDEPGQSAIARALAPYTDYPLPLTPAASRSLEANGLRMVRAPLADVPGIESSLRLIGARNRQWVGWALEWREVFAGRSITPDSVLVIDGQRERAPGGGLRLIARCWTAPCPDSDGACLRLEMAAQLRGAREPTDSRAATLGLNLLAPGPDSLDARAEGRLFPCLSFEGALEPGYAYILTAEAPGAVWGEPGAGESAERDDDSGMRAIGGSAAPSGASVGPVGLIPPTVGEAMLMNLSRETHEPAARAVIVLIPRTPKAPAALAPASAAQPGASTRE